MTIFQLISTTVLAGLFDWMAFAYLAQTIKFKSAEHAFGAVGGLLFSFGIVYPVLTSGPLNYMSAIFIVVQVILAGVAFWRGWKDKDYLEVKPQKPDPYLEEDEFEE